MSLDQAASHMRVCGEDIDLGARRGAENREIALLLVGVTATGAHVDFPGSRVIANRVRPKRYRRRVGHCKRRPIESFYRTICSRGDEEPVELGHEKHTLWLGKAGQCSGYPARLEVDYLDGVL